MRPPDKVELERTSHEPRRALLGFETSKYDPKAHATKKVEALATRRRGIFRFPCFVTAWYIPIIENKAKAPETSATYPNNTYPLNSF